MEGGDLGEGLKRRRESSLLIGYAPDGQNPQREIRQRDQESGHNVQHMHILALVALPGAATEV